MRRPTAILALLVGLTAAAARAPVAAPTHASEANPMHPAFVVLDASGSPAAISGRPAAVEATCGACHDATYITAHSDHWNDRVKATCAECHFEGGAFPRDPAAYDDAGRLRREMIRISTPTDANCEGCHGIVHEGEEPLSIPPEFGPGTDTTSKGYDITFNTGAIISSQDMARSYVNLEAKASRNSPWDAHARRLVRCVDCHFAPNNPAKADMKLAKLRFLVDDPRRIPLSEFLHEPDHRLAAATCRSCHDPTKAHDFLPYKKRHFDVLECQACHIPHPMGPAARTIDATVITLGRQPAVLYRGMELREGDSFNAAYARGYSPILLPRRGPDGDTKLAPYNAVDAWFWADGPGGPPLATELVARAYLEDGRYAPEVVALFDADHDGRLESSELRLDTPAKTDLIRSRLRALGVPDPRIRRDVSFHPLEHGVQAGQQVERDCASCHEGRSRVDIGLSLASFTPVGAEPSTKSPPVDPRTSARILPDVEGSRVEPNSSAGFYVLGHSRSGWADRLGLAVFILVLLGVAGHATLRILSRGATGGVSGGGTQRVYLYSAYERLWHWLMGLSILILMLTGLQIHFFGAWRLLALPRAVAIHNFFAVVLTVNAFLSLFYHLATSAIRQFVPPKETLIAGVAAQARYYARGIFLGQPHPSPKTPERKLNPLQQVTYLALLNILFPVQVVTGILIWGASRWPSLAQATGGLTIVAPLHSLCSWFFLTFVLLHVYLTTTGRTAFSNVSAMIDGYEEIELGRRTAAGGSHA